MPPSRADSSLQHEISARAFMDERAALHAMLGGLAHVEALETGIMQRATGMVETLRKQGNAGAGVEAFLHEYGLDTQEGLAIMCLAEALLRIPDAETANRLIADKFEHTSWEHHLGQSDSFFVNASSWGLLLTGKVVQFSEAKEKPTALLRRMVGQFGDPVIRTALKQAMKFIGAQFVLGENISEALANAGATEKHGYRHSYDILGEGARSDAQAQHYVDAYRDAIAKIGKHAAGKSLFAAPSISVKLSALHPRYSLPQQARVMQELLPRLKAILLQAKQVGITVSIDAEEATRLDVELDLFKTIFADPDFAGWNGIGFVLQAYQKRAFYVIDFLRELAQAHGRIMPLRLVKGAYWDSEIKLAQMQGLPNYPVFTRKEHTDVSYLACADKILQSAACFYPQFATHNARTITSVMALAERYNVAKDAFEFQRLHGMGAGLHDLVLPEIASRIYAPVGEHKDLLAYLIRRLLENGANTSFVHLLMDDETPVAELLADPLAKTKAHDATPNPQIPLPDAIYGKARKNSRGLDLGNREMLQALNTATQKHEKIMNTIQAKDTTAVELNAAMNVAAKAWKEWTNTTVEQRATLLEKVADTLEAHREELIALCTQEAGKALADGIAEVREAADFCRYYATEARKLMQAETVLAGPTGEHNALALHPRGVFACISPWNFPLAIFMGQVVAALATGNTVVAKPAEQTPRVAIRAVELMREAGIPKEVLQLVQGTGEAVGAPLVADERIAGVVFTGSVETAKRINQSLANRKGAIIPLIAETGGQNCMVVDSSALLEQAVDDIVLSAFGSAGQRCSALRVLFVQEDVADALLKLLAGAMAELKIANPADPATDIGPLIDAEAKQNVVQHIARMKQEAKLIAAVPMAENLQGNFVAPHAFEIKNITQLEREIFGPVLHVVRFKATEMEKVAEAINATGYGLTFGIHSRIEDHVQFFSERIHAGNIYVNRSMIGATVGVQPFGGEGLSGTGPKAGGPYYLLRFLTERTRSINTAAIGGNLSLLSQQA